MSKKNLFHLPVFYVAVAFYIVVSFMVLMLGEKAAALTVREDRYFEVAGALSFFVASIFFFFSFLRSRRMMEKNGTFWRWLKPLIFLGLAGIFFFGGGEEISWGQRIFNVETPQSLEQINDQDEITIHNLVIGGANIPFETMFDVLWLSFAVLLPLAAKFHKPFGLFAARYLPISHWGIGVLFVFNYLYAKAAKAIYPAFYTYDVIPFRQAVQEIKESNYAILFALVALFLFVGSKRESSA